MKAFSNKTFNKSLFIYIFIFLFSHTDVMLGKTAEQPPLKLWYNKPAIEWMTSALPIGNGELGGMFFGKIEKEEIQFNEKTLWQGDPNTRGAYQNFGSLFLEFQGHETYTNYRRELDLNKAIGSVFYKMSDVNYLREYFVSNPDSVLVIRLSSPEQKAKLSFSVVLESAQQGTTTITGNHITMSGKLDLLSFEAQVRVLNEGGSLSANTNSIVVKEADAVTILLTGATNFNIASDDYMGESADLLHKRLSKRINNASERTYSTLKTTHLNDYQPRFDKVKFDLGVDMPNIPTDELVRSHRDHSYLDILYFQYGRYLLLSSSRGMNLPNNLQGIWNNDNTPPWECDIHSNINIQMNYWPAENTNLSECHMPFLNYIATEALRENGSFQKVARSENNRGWTLRTQSNIFAYTDWNINRPANAWYCMHLWQHYAYTNDLTFLRTTAFPVMKSACEYWFDRLKEDERGRLIAPDEWSPEQGPWEDGVAYAQQLIWELFDKTLKSAELLNENDLFVTQLSEKYAKLDNGIEIGSWGQIKEWKYDTKKLDTIGNTHRHLSHLIALYPGNQISYLKDTGHANAAKKTLESRGDEGTGWSRAWKIACWARLFDGDHAYKLLKAALNMATITRISMRNQDGGVYENLLDAHPPFQIDGNFGATAGIAEMLLQSHLDEIHLLPALPQVWSSGSIQGLKAEGNFEVNLSWDNNRLTESSIISGSGNICRLRTSVPVKIIDIATSSTKNGVFYVTTFETEKGKKYIIKAIEKPLNN